MTAPLTLLLRQRLDAVGWGSIVRRGALLAAGFMVLAGGDRSALPFAAIVTLIALSVSLALPSPPAPRWSAVGLMRFAGSFLFSSLRGGVDVAWRALTPRRPLAPALLHFESRLTTQPARNLFTSAVNLMPGTLCVSVDGARITIHALFMPGGGEEIVAQLRQLEGRVARALGETLEEGAA